MVGGGDGREVALVWLLRRFSRYSSLRGFFSNVDSGPNGKKMEDRTERMNLREKEILRQDVKENQPYRPLTPPRYAVPDEKANACLSLSTARYKVKRLGPRWTNSRKGSS